MNNSYTPFHADRLKREAESTAILHGFLDDERRERMPHTVCLYGLTRAALGDELFGPMLHSCLASAAKIAPRNFFAEALYQDFDRVGYEFIFANADCATRFELLHQALVSRKPQR